MSATIAVDGVFAARIDDELTWRVRAEDPIVRSIVEKTLNGIFGESWTPAFGEYVPDNVAARANAAAELFGADVLSIDPAETLPDNAIP